MPQRSDTMCGYKQVVAEKCTTWLITQWAIWYSSFNNQVLTTEGKEALFKTPGICIMPGTYLIENITIITAIVVVSKEISLATIHLVKYTWGKGSHRLI